MKNKNLFVISTLCYGGIWQNLAWEYAARTGVKNVDLRFDWGAWNALAPELMVDEPWHGKWQFSVADLKAELSRLQVTPVTSFCNTLVYYRFGVDAVKRRIELLHKLGIKYCIPAPWPRQLPGNEKVLYDHWKELCDYAEVFGMNLYVETLGGTMNNAEECLKTIKNVGRKNLKITFPADNALLRNVGLNVVDEVNRLGEHIGVVLLRDIEGEGIWNFPALGDGAVDFPGMFKALENHGFYGPYVLTLEGHKGLDNATLEGHHADVLKSIKYLRSIGVWE